MRQTQGFLGRWNLTGTGEDTNRVYWLEVSDKGGALTGMFLNRGGSPVPLASVAVQNGELVFQLAPGSNKQPGAEFRARLEGSKLVGTTKADNRVINFVGVRPPTWPKSDANATHTYGTPVELFDGKTMNGFDTQPSNYPVTWAVEDGVLVNAPPTRNLISKQKFMNFRIQAEYKLFEKSNSGIYLRGRYEVQIEDTAGQDVDSHHCGGVYGFLVPSVNAARPAGEWQTIEITLIGRAVTVVLNGERIIDRQPIPGITGGALDSAEGDPGPILLQGDHGPVEFRKLTLTPAAAK